MLAPDQLVDSCSPTHISSFARRQFRPLPRTLPMGRRSVHKFTYENVSKWYWRLLKCCTARAARTENWTGNPDEAPACAALQRLSSPDWNGTERTRHAHAATSVTHLSLNWTQLRLPPLRLQLRLWFRFLFCILTTNLHALETVFWALLILTKSRLAYVQHRRG